jgi:hypothetical protein
VEPLYLAVGLRPIWPGSFGCDGQLGAGIEPHLAAVARTVVGQHALDDDAAFGKPGDGVTQNRDSGLLRLVVVDLGVGHA